MDKTIILVPGESEQVSFQIAAPSGLGDHTVSLDGLSGSFKVVTPVVPPFTMVITNIAQSTDQYATAYWIVEITAKITNLSSYVVTHDLACGKCRPSQQDENNAYSYSSRLWSASIGAALAVTLNPGQSVTLVSPFYVAQEGYPPERANEDLMYHSGTKIRYAWRIRDELLNMSPSAYAGTYP